MCTQKTVSHGKVTKRNLKICPQMCSRVLSVEDECCGDTNIYKHLIHNPRETTKPSEII